MSSYLCGLLGVGRGPNGSGTGTSRSNEMGTALRSKDLPLKACDDPLKDISGDKKLSLTAKGGTAQVKSLEVWELKSAWPK